MTITKIGGKINLYTNGKLSSTTAGTCATPSNAYSLEILRWKYEDGSYYANDSAMALFRTSNTVPSAEQIAKIYNDEKHLFQENAKATLYGTSDAVTALAYDDDTELLHVGTSAGRSVFQGLNRVDNTTDAVDTAISASNGFIVED
jgi:trimeric autotransporter adhesin